MKISGFSLIRNGTQFDYPFLESLRSLLPLVDELIVNIGKGDDDTLSKVQAFSKDEGHGKCILFESDWNLDDPEKKRGGQILSEQTNLALQKTSGDWCIYLQADEILHEHDIPRIRQAFEIAQQKSNVEGLLFDYVHFYGSYDVVQYSRSTYRREVRAFRKDSGAQSVGDAQSFRKKDGSKLNVIHSGARVFHYGWVRTPEAMREKTYFMDQLYHGDPTPENSQTRLPHTGENYRYKKIWGLKPFEGSHPSSMKNRIQAKAWHWDLAHSPLCFSWKDSKRIVLDLIEGFTGYRFFEYRSYKLIK